VNPITRLGIVNRGEAAIRLLTAVAEEGTVLKGSQVLNIAQPAATMPGAPPP